MERGEKEGGEERGEGEGKRKGEVRGNEVLYLDESWITSISVYYYKQ